MTSVSKSAPRVRISKPRNTSAAVRRTFIKALTGGVAALAIVFTVMVGAGWLLANFLQARSDIRSVAAGPAARPAWIALPGGGMAAQAAVVASLSAPETKRSSSEARMLDPIGALALVIPDTPDSPATMGSIVTKSAEPVALNVAAAGLPSRNSRSRNSRSRSCHCPGHGWRRSDLFRISASRRRRRLERRFTTSRPRPFTCRAASGSKPIPAWAV